MSARNACLLGLALLCIGAAGCAVPDSFGGYLQNRRHDLIDVAHVDFSAVSLGPVVYAGPLLAGLNIMTGYETRTPGGSLQIGLGGPRIQERTGTAAGLLWPASKWDEDQKMLGLRPKRTPSGFSVGAAVGLVFGVGAEVDVIEAVDFVFGLLCIDIGQDDEAGIDIEEEPPAAPVTEPAK